jgi:two-component system, NarL family, invasion response regulator UvrY
VIKILVADCHPIIRKGLKATFEEIPGMTVHCEARHGHEILEILSQKRIDVVVIEVSFSGEPALQTIEEIKRRHQNMPILLYTTICDDELVRSAFKSGAAGCVTKNTALDELVRAVRTIANGGKYLTESLAFKLAEHTAWPTRRTGMTLREALSSREYQISHMIASGKTIKEIAQELFLSSKTVSTYRARILSKMKMKSNAELIAYVLRRMRAAAAWLFFVGFAL